MKVEFTVGADILVQDIQAQGCVSPYGMVRLTIEDDTLTVSPSYEFPTDEDAQRDFGKDAQKVEENLSAQAQIEENYPHENENIPEQFKVRSVGEIRKRCGEGIAPTHTERDILIEHENIHGWDF